MSTTKSLDDEAISETASGSSNREEVVHPSSHPTESDPPCSAPISTENKPTGCPLNDDYTRRERIFVLFASMLLAFNRYVSDFFFERVNAFFLVSPVACLHSGYVNGTCLSGFLTPGGAKASVSAFTGSYTNSALQVANGDDPEMFGFLIAMILSYIFGSFLSSILTPNPEPWRIAPSFGPTFLMGAALLGAGSVFAALDPQDEKHFFYFAAAANGVQNGVSSMYSANLIRTTHMTGLSTDVGLFLGQLIRGNTKNLWKLQILIGLGLSFWLGGFVSLFAAKHLTSNSLLVNAALFLAIGCALIFFLVRNLDISFNQAMLGTWHWAQALEKLRLQT